jgi:opacity protein-like surface antigen
MKNTITTIFALALSTSAYATDVPSGKAAPKAPTPVFVSADNYVGVNVGANVTDGVNKQAPTAFGVLAGRKVLGFGPMGFTAEAAYDYTKGNTNMVSGNALVSYTVGPFSPYALGGVGYRWVDSKLPASLSKDQAVWSAGGGVKFAVTTAIELDARYRRVENFDYKGAEDRVSLGVNYRF